MTEKENDTKKITPETDKQQAENPSLLEEYMRAHQHPSKGKKGEQEEEQQAKNESSEKQPDKIDQSGKSTQQETNQLISNVSKEEVPDSTAEKSEKNQQPVFDEIEMVTNAEQTTEDKGSEETIRSNSNKLKSKSTKRTVTILLVLAVVAVVGIAYYQQWQTKNTLAQQKTERVAAEKILASYYSDEEQLFPKTAQTEKGFKKLTQAVAKTKEQENTHDKLVKQVKQLKTKTKQVAAVNQLFTQAVITDDQYKAGLLKADTPITVAKRSEKNAFDKMVNQALTEAENQYKQLQTAKAKVKAVYDGEKVTDAATRDAYNQAKTEVDKIKNQDLKTNIGTALVQVNEELTKKETAAKAKAEQEKQAAAEKEKQAAAAATATKAAATTSNDPTKTSIMTPNQTQIADTNNAAWSWNEGIMNKVIATCIQRGYIVSGGYTLQKNSIVNGEGYYDLYATNLDSQLLKSYKAEQLPVYLVTINCKTGWFQGRGPK